MQYKHRPVVSPLGLSKLLIIKAKAKTYELVKIGVNYSILPLFLSSINDDDDVHSDDHDDDG